MGYKLLRKTRKDTKFRLMGYFPNTDYASKIIDLFKRRKIIKLNEKKDLNKTAIWKIVPITKREAMMAEKDVPF